MEYVLHRSVCVTQNILCVCPQMLPQQEWDHKRGARGSQVSVCVCVCVWKDLNLMKPVRTSLSYTSLQNQSYRKLFLLKENKVIKVLFFC